MSILGGPEYPWPVRYLPAESVCNKDDKEAMKKYDAMTDDQKKQFGGLWWSMHDIITVFGGGLFKEENDENYFNFVVDFSAPELAEARVVDPLLVTNIDKTMNTYLTTLSTAIGAEFQKQQLASSAALSNAVTNVAAANRPVFTAPGVPGAPADPNAPAGAPGAFPGAPPEPIYSAANLEKECLRDISKIEITSKSRIFVVEKQMVQATAEMSIRIKSKGDFEKLSELPPGALPSAAVPGAAQVIGAAALPGTVPGMGAAAQAAGRYRTRKGRKGAQKKRKTRRARKLPFRKR
jgi:hypothetical protein